MRLRPLCFSTVMILCFWGNLPLLTTAAVWKAAGEIGFVHFYAEMKEEEDLVTVLLRIENHSKVESFKVTRFFVQMTDASNQRVRPVTADEVVSGYLKQLRELLPRHAAEIDSILGEIRADFPQEKIVEVYGRLKEYMRQGRPVTWRTELENWLLGKRQSNEADIAKADQIIEKIGILAKNYFWPTEIAPDSNYTGVVFFRKPMQQPVNIFFQVGEEFIGTQMRIVIGDEKGQTVFNP